jgi:hypothetical protein
MLSKVLGILDLVAGGIFLLSIIISALPKTMVIISAVYFMVKGFLFLLVLDFASIIDFICGIIILMSAWTAIPLVLSIVVLLFLAQKGILSLIS